MFRATRLAAAAGGFSTDIDSPLSTRTSYAGFTGDAGAGGGTRMEVSFGVHPRLTISRRCDEIRVAGFLFEAAAVGKSYIFISRFRANKLFQKQWIE